MLTNKESVKRRRRQRIGFCSDRTGTAAVEFAIIAPVLLAMLLGLLAYGIYLSAVHSVRQLAADAARETIAGIDDAERLKIVEDFVAANGDKYPMIDSRDLKISAHADANDASRFVIEVSYDAADLPIWSLAPFVPLPSQFISGSFTIADGGF